MKKKAIAAARNAVRRAYGMEIADIRQRNRTAAVASARRTYAILLREFTNMSLHQIGDEMHRDHSTIVNLVHNKLKMHPDFSPHHERAVKYMAAHIEPGDRMKLKQWRQFRNRSQAADLEVEALQRQVQQLLEALDDARRDVSYWRKRCADLASHRQQTNGQQ